MTRRSENVALKGRVGQVATVQAPGRPRSAGAYTGGPSECPAGTYPQERERNGHRERQTRHPDGSLGPTVTPVSCAFPGPWTLSEGQEPSAWRKGAGRGFLKAVAGGDPPNSMGTGPREMEAGGALGRGGVQAPHGWCQHGGVWFPSSAASTWGCGRCALPRSPWAGPGAPRSQAVFGEGSTESTNALGSGKPSAHLLETETPNLGASLSRELEQGVEVASCPAGAVPGLS